uniref:SFRICE_019587 n=1 Tax=Spodoptera frugiperda TaxID=7108 RepID=A0A2H1W5E2_SPOFR
MDGIQTDLAADGSVDPRSVDVSQLHQSRFGLISQALMLILIAGFLASETLSEFWKTKVPVVSRNWHDLVFRLAEIGVALWFPCVLWNSMAPERLWLLNPRRLLARQLDDARLADLLAQHHDAKNLVESHRLSWTERAQLVVRVVSLCRCIVARTILSVLKPQLAIKNSAEDPNDTVLDLPDRLGAKRYRDSFSQQFTQFPRLFQMTEFYYE